MRTILAATISMISMVSILAVGCGGVAPVALEAPNPAPYMTYQIGNTMRVATGMPMVRWTGNVVSLPAFQMTRSIGVDGTNAQPPGKGSVWLAMYSYHGNCTGGRFVVVHPGFYRQQIGLVIDERGALPCEEAVIQVDGSHTGRVFRVTDDSGSPAFRPAEPVVVGAIGLPTTWELVYNGRSGNTVSLAYHEYAPGPMGAQSTERYHEPLLYELKKSRRIVFRQMEIEILDASNAGVTFRVLRDGREAAEAPQQAQPGQ